MTLFLLVFLVMTSLMTVPFMLQPLSLGMMLLVSTLMLSVLMAVEISSWFSYVLFLIYVGGLLVMFAYIAALIPNILFIFTGSITKPILVILGSIFIIYHSYSPDSLSLSFIFDHKALAMKYAASGLVSLEILSVFISLAIVLFLCLIIVVKICYTSPASLRPFK